MKRSPAIVAALLTGLSLSAAAQAPAAPAGPAKIAVVAFQAAVAQTNEFQRDFGDLQKKFVPKRDQLKALSDEIDGLKKQLQAQGSTLTEAERASRTKAIDDKSKQLQRAAEEAQNDFKQEMQDTYGGVATKVGALLVDYAKQQGYTLVLDGGQQEAAVILYANQSTDITKALIDAYNVKSGIPAPPPQAAAAAPRPASAAPKPAARTSAGH
ncbi:MAG: OmpH family outer membrane protein [Acidobacteriota bacterium]|nr:OmpH family outer membrane protein [Acidobacteriota bacterium]